MIDKDVSIPGEFVQTKRKNMGVFRIVAWTLFAVSLVASITSVLWWHLVNPTSLGPAEWTRSTNRDVYGDSPGTAVREASTREWWNWGYTFRFTPSRVFFPETLESLQDIVRTSERVRLVGGGHSFSPSIATDYTSIDLRYLNTIGPIHQSNISVGPPGHPSSGLVVVVGAGASVRQVQHNLVVRGYNLHGFGGGTHHMTMGGGISTSLHGSQSHPLARHVVSLGVVLANGTTVQLTQEDALFSAVKAGLGRLGVIYKATIRVYARKCLRVNARESTLSEALDELASQRSMGEFQATEWGLRNNRGILHTYHDTGNASCPSDYPLVVDRSAGSNANPYTTDHWISAAQVLFAMGTQWEWVYNIYASSLIENHDAVIGLEDGWRYGVSPMFGQHFTEYSVPRGNCSGTIDDILKVAERNKFILTSINVRSLTAPDPYTLLAYAPVSSCALEVYAPTVQFHYVSVFTQIQEVVIQRGGRSHFGTLFFGTQRNITTRLGDEAAAKEAKYWAFVDEYDPSGKFRTLQTDWMDKYYIEFDDLATRAVLFRVWVWTAFLFGVLWLVSLCLCGCRERYNCRCCSCCPGYRDPSYSLVKYW